MNFIRCMVVVGSLIAGLASATAPKPHNTQRTSTVAVPFDATWSAVVDLFSENSWPIANIDRASGIITTGEVPAADIYCDCGGHGISTVIATRGTLSIRVKAQDDGTTTMDVDVSFAQVRSFDNAVRRVDCTSRGVLESRIHDGVAYRAAEAEKRAARSKPTAPAQRFFCTSAPADESLGWCSRSEAGCAKRQADIVVLVGDATPCTEKPRAVCFTGKNAADAQEESCHPNLVSCEAEHTAAIPRITEPTACAAIE